MTSELSQWQCEREPHGRRGIRSCNQEPEEPTRACLNVSLSFRVHGANKLAAKHDRVKLEEAAEPVQCDICQDRPAVLFCSEDRALICRRCNFTLTLASSLAPLTRGPISDRMPHFETVQQPGRWAPAGGTDSPGVLLLSPQGGSCHTEMYELQAMAYSGDCAGVTS